jgi:hypothetical protein
MVIESRPAPLHADADQVLASASTGPVVMGSFRSIALL